MCTTCHQSNQRAPRDAQRHASHPPKATAAQIPYQSVWDMWEIRSYQRDVVGGILQMRWVHREGEDDLYSVRGVCGPASKCLQLDGG